MSHQRHDAEMFRLGRVPSPLDLCRSFAYPNTVPMIVPLPMTGGAAVLLVSYSPKLAVIPAAHYDRHGALRRFSTKGLTRSSRNDLPFPYEVESLRPLRTARDPQILGEEWARQHLDLPVARRV